jgi:hypothetical protein
MNPLRRFALAALAALAVAGCTVEVSGIPDVGSAGADAGALGDVGARPDGSTSVFDATVPVDATVLADVGAVDGSVAVLDAAQPDASSPGLDASAPDTGPAFGAELFVATDGKDTNVGTIDQPFATLERAQTAARALKKASGMPAGGIAVTVRGGVYERSAAFKLAIDDSGLADKPMVYRGFPGEQVRLVGGKVIDPTAFKPVTSASPVWSRLDTSAQGQVVAADLKALGITDFGTLTPRGMSSGSPAALELFFARQPMTLARWPDPTEDDPVSTFADDTIQLYGTGVVPDVTGTYVKSGTSDGVNAYQRQGLVGGKQYNLYRYNWDYQSQNYTAWFLTTNASGYPGSTDPWWYRYAKEIGPMNGSNGAVGTVTNHKPGALNHGFAPIAEAVSDTEFRYYGTRPERWKAATDVWFHGYWMWSWADLHVGAVSIDTATKLVTLTQKPGYGILAGQPYYAENLLEEITTPGEWYLDRASGLLYFWPPAPMAGAEIIVSMLAAPIVQADKVSYLTLQGLELEAGRANLVQVNGGDHVRIFGCKLLNAGTTAVQLSGSSHSLERSEIGNAGDRGVHLSGGTRSSLTPGGNLVKNCEIHHFGRWSWTYNPGVYTDGDGNAVAHCSFHDAPHTAILYIGNDHVFEYNDIHHVLQYSSDAGAIYTGRDWGYRGNEVRYNFIHDIASFFEGYGVHGVYLDDCVSGIHVHGNVLYRISGLGILHGGGRDDIMENNLIVKCGTALSADSRGLTAINNTPGDSWDFLERLTNDGIQYQQPPWSTAYPLLAVIPNDWAAITAPGALWRNPQGCVFSRNLGWQNGQFTSEQAGTFAVYAEMKDNVADTDPKFVDESKLDLQLAPDSPAYSIPGWEPVAFEKIGIEPP